MSKQDRQDELSNAMASMGLGDMGNVDIVDPSGCITIDFSAGSDDIANTVKEIVKEELAKVKEQEEVDIGLDIGLDIAQYHDKYEQELGQEREHKQEKKVIERVIVKEEVEVVRRKKGLKHANRRLIRGIKGFGELLKLTAIVLIIAVVAMIVGETYYAQVSATPAPIAFVAYSDFVKSLLGKVVDIAEVVWLMIKEL